MSLVRPTEVASVGSRVLLTPLSQRPRSPWAFFVFLLIALQAPGVLLAAESEPAAPVAIARADTAPIVREVRVIGTVTSPRTASLSTQVAGLVRGLDVDAGAQVARGEVLVELDREVAAFALEIAQAEVAGAAAALADARRRVEEGRALVGDGGFSQSELDGLIAEVAVDEAALAAAEAEARHQAALLERYQVKAPFAAVVAERVAELGEWIAPGDPLLELVAIDGLRLDFRVPQELFPRLARDTEVSLRLDAVPEQPFPGRIQAIVPVSDPAARTFLVRILPAGEAHPAMAPGMSARARLRLDTGREGVVVPRDALLRYPDGRVLVWRLDRTGERLRVRESQVELGLSFEDRVEIRRGVEAGFEVVVEGNEALQDGQAVRLRGGTP